MGSRRAGTDRIHVTMSMGGFVMSGGKVSTTRPDCVDVMRVMVEMRCRKS